MGENHESEQNSITYTQGPVNKESKGENKNPNTLKKKKVAES